MQSEILSICCVLCIVPWKQQIYRYIDTPFGSGRDSLLIPARCRTLDQASILTTSLIQCIVDGRYGRASPLIQTLGADG
jgi:hypothetical protein